MVGCGKSLANSELSSGSLNRPQISYVEATGCGKVSIRFGKLGRKDKDSFEVRVNGVYYFRLAVFNEPPDGWIHLRL